MDVVPALVILVVIGALVFVLSAPLRGKGEDLSLIHI